MNTKEYKNALMDAIVDWADGNIARVVAMDEDGHIFVDNDQTFDEILVDYDCWLAFLGDIDPTEVEDTDHFSNLYLQYIGEDIPDDEEEEATIDAIAKEFPKQVKADSLFREIVAQGKEAFGRHSFSAPAGEGKALVFWEEYISECPKIVLKGAEGNTEYPIITCYFNDGRAVFVIDDEGTIIEILNFVQDFDFSATAAYCHKATVALPRFHKNPCDKTVTREVLISLD